MFKRTFTLRHQVVCAFTVACCSVTVAQTPNLVTTPVEADRVQQDMARMLELNTSFQNLTAGYGNWRDVTLKGAYGLPSHLLQGELSLTRRFDTSGAFVGLSDTYTLNEDYYGSVAVGFGDGAFYLPRYRVDATIYKKWQPDRRLVTSLGAGYYKATDGHSDNSLSLGVVYYFDAPWIAEAGLRINNSNPGAIKTHQQFVAVTYGTNKQSLLTVRHGWGAEGYQTISPSNAQLVNFKSKETSVSWRYWVAPRTGVVLGANQYNNPSYIRSGASIGIFHDF